MTFQHSRCSWPRRIVPIAICRQRMPPRPEPTLCASQSAFAAALRSRLTGAPAHDHPQEIGGPPGITPAARLDVYANNARFFFGLALERTYPVMRHRVGD